MMVEGKSRFHELKEEKEKQTKHKKTVEEQLKEQEEEYERLLGEFDNKLRKSKVYRDLTSDIYAIKMTLDGLSKAFGNIGKTHRVEALVNLGNYENIRFVSIEGIDWEKCFQDIEDGIGRLTSFEAQQFLDSYIRDRRKSKS